MSITDIFFLTIVLGLGVYGVFADLRRTLFLLVSLLLIFLVVLLSTSYFEHFIMRSAGINPADFSGAPAVAVLILEGSTVYAFIAALIPFFIFIFIMTVYFLFDILLLKRLSVGKKNALPFRIAGFAAGAVSGIILVILYALQLSRLPWPPAAGIFSSSYFLSLFEYAAPYFVPVISGGM